MVGCFLSFLILAFLLSLSPPFFPFRLLFPCSFYGSSTTPRLSPTPAFLLSPPLHTLTNIPQVRPPPRLRHLHRPARRRISESARLRVRHQDDHHQGQLRRQPQGLGRDARLLPPRAHQGALQGRRLVGAADGL